MAIRRYKPTSPGRRGMSVSTREEVTTDKPYKPLTEALKKHSGRNNQGRISVRHQGGREKRFYRKIDFKRDKLGIPAKVATIEYDPNRSARIALLNYVDGEKRYMLAPNGLKVGDTVQSGTGSPIRVGNAMTLRDLPVGTQIHNIELYAGRGGQMVRSAGASAQLMAKQEDYAQIRMPSGEVRLGASELHGDDWSGRKRRSRECRHWQGRPGAAHGQAADGAWLGHESARPSARRR